MPAPKQNAPKIRSLLRSAGPGVRVRQDWLANRLGLSASEIAEALDAIETKTFQVMRFRGAGASVAMA